MRRGPVSPSGSGPKPEPAFALLRRLGAQAQGHAGGVMAGKLAGRADPGPGAFEWPAERCLHRLHRQAAGAQQRGRALDKADDG